MVTTVATMDDDDLIVEGYITCQCGSWILPQRQFCDECLEDLGAEVERAVTIEVGGRPVHLAPRKPKKRPKQKPKKPKGSGNYSMERRARDRCHQRALARLMRIYEPMYEVIYFEEQIREGLEPKPFTSKTTHSPTATIESLISDLEDYRSRLGVTFDNPASTVPGSAQRDRPAE